MGGRKKNGEGKEERKEEKGKKGEGTGGEKVKQHRSLGCGAVLNPLRKKGDSNPRYPVKGIPVFETSAFSHSAILP